MIIRDNLHIKFNYLDSFNKLYNCVVCPREAGKTSELEFTKIFKAIKKGYGVIILMRFAKEVHKYTLKGIEDRINLYLNDEDQIRIIADKEIGGGITTGIIYFNIAQHNEYLPGQGLLMWLGLDDQILKKTYIKNPRFIIFDEYVLNPKSRERYIVNEFEKIILLHGSITRYQEPGKLIKVYLCGNPTSKLNPFNEYLKINYKKIKEGATVTGPNFVLWCYKLKEELKNKLLKTNPNYQFDQSYSRFALNGVYIYDENRINLLPDLLQNFRLDYVIAFIDLSFKTRYLGIYYNNLYSHDNHDLDYIIKEIDNINKINNHYVYSFSFKDMQHNTFLLNEDNIDVIGGLRSSLCDGRVGFVNTFYYISDLFDTYVKKI